MMIVAGLITVAMDSNGTQGLHILVRPPTEKKKAKMEREQIKNDAKDDKRPDFLCVLLHLECLPQLRIFHLSTK